VTLLSVQDVGVRFGGVQALDGVSLQVRQGQIFAIIGPNGAGKTTLFNVISGLYRPSSGRVLMHTTQGEVDITAQSPQRLAALGLSRSFQNLQIFFRMSAAENVMVGRHLHEQRNVFAHLLALPSVRRQNRESRRVADELLDFVGLAHCADRSAGTLPYGELKRLEIARALATEPKLLLLDEPAAGCNAAETQTLSQVIRRIAERGTTVALIEHDMKMVMQISHRIHVLNQGRTLAEGSAAEVTRSPEVMEAYLGRHGSKEAALAQH
jgi:branched-chain amino acid transport system ATP-binding protein